MDQRVVKVVCGLFSDSSQEVQRLLAEAAAEKGYQFVFVNRYRKEGVLQYVEEHDDVQVVVLQESLQRSSPYSAEDLSLLMEHREDLNVVISLDKGHYGNRYMRILYAAGITSAVFDTDAYTERVVELMLKKRSKKEARQYYGIVSMEDAQQGLGVLEEEKTKAYVRYLEEGQNQNETEKRYHFIKGQLTLAQNILFLNELPEPVRLQLKENKDYQNYCCYLPSQKRSLPFLKKNKQAAHSGIRKASKGEAKKRKESQLAPAWIVPMGNGVSRVIYE